MKTKDKDNKDKNKSKVNEDANLLAVAAGLAGVVASGVGIAGLMELLKEKYPEAYAALSKVGKAASGSRQKGVNASESKGKIRLQTVSESLSQQVED